MIIRMKYQFNKNYIMEKKEIKLYRNKMITGIKETQILKNYIDPIEKQNKFKALKKKVKINDSEKH